MCDSIVLKTDARSDFKFLIGYHGCIRPNSVYPKLHFQISDDKKNKVDFSVARA